MKTLTLNKEFLHRHLFALVVFAGLGVWFGYDGFVRYPATPAAQLYESIEKSAPPPTMSPEKLEAFKRQKIQSQYGFCILPLIAAFLVGLHLASLARLKFAFDDQGFTLAGKRYAFSDIKTIDRSRWDKKSILKLTLADDTTVTLDGWHHTGVDDFAKRLPA